MAEAARQPYLSVKQYLASEAEWPTRREYVDGQVYDMAGASMGHTRIVRNLSRRLDVHLERSNCEVSTNDLKVKIRETAYYYPDLVVTCESLPDNAFLCEKPLLVVEVLSPTTARMDRIEKMNAYQHLPGLREYAIISQDRMRIEIYRHEQAGETWQCEAYTEPEQELLFESVGATVKLADIYRRVRFAASPEQEEQEEEQTNV